MTRSAERVLERDVVPHDLGGYDERNPCFSAYFEAGQLAPQVANPYEPPLYAGPGSERRWIGSFEVDAFLYPPPFLLLPMFALAWSRDFLTLRAVLVCR